MNSQLQGPFAVQLTAFISQKKALGYVASHHEYYAKLFDQLTFEQNSDSTVITKKLVREFCKKQFLESDTTISKKASFIRQFTIFLIKQGISGCYIMPPSMYPAGPHHIPHIFSEDELKLFFGAADNLSALTAQPYRTEALPLIFRMMYQCGLRPKEPLHLRLGDVNIEQGTLFIRCSKSDRDRFVPMPRTLVERCSKYIAIAHDNVEHDPKRFLFYYTNPHVPYKSTVQMFHKILWDARIPYYGQAKGPAQYDFRHTFACHSYKQIVESGLDVLAMTPVLATYMGHVVFRETTYYLRLTADVFPSIRAKMKILDVIPALQEAQDAIN